MTQNNERKFTSLYFENEELNGKKVEGKYKKLNIRFLYKDVQDIPQGRAHLFEYSKGKYAKVLCLNDGLYKKDIALDKCPLCQTDQYGTPASKLFAFVSDLNDEGKLKLFEFSYTLSKQINDMAEETGTPLHDIEFTIIRKGTRKETVYTPMPKNVKKFSVRDYFFELGLDSYPKLVGSADERPAILQLDATAMQEFIKGNYPWSSGDGGAKRKYTSLTGATTTIHGGDDEPKKAMDASEDFSEVGEFGEDVLEDFGTPNGESLF